jgi:hypothetical protein
MLSKPPVQSYCNLVEEKSIFTSCEFAWSELGMGMGCLNAHIAQTLNAYVAQICMMQVEVWVNGTLFFTICRVCLMDYTSYKL